MQRKGREFVLSVLTAVVSLQQMLKDRFVQFKIKRYMTVLKLWLLCAIFFLFKRSLISCHHTYMCVSA